MAWKSFELDEQHSLKNTVASVEENEEMTHKDIIMHLTSKGETPGEKEIRKADDIIQAKITAGDFRRNPNKFMMMILFSTG